MKIILTGATGFIGSNLLKKLSSKSNYKILCISRSNLYKKNSKNIFFVKSDLGNLKKNSKFISKFCPQILIHLAWDKIPNFNSHNSKNNEKNSKKLIDFVCKNTEVKKIIIAGSCFEIRKPNNTYKYFVNAKKNILSYLKSKCKEYKIQYNWLRIFYVYGPGQREKSIIPYLISCSKKNEVAEIREPSKRHDFIFIEDVCDAIINTIKYSKRSKIDDIGSGKVISIKKIIYYLKKISKNNILIKTKKKTNFKKDKIIKANIKNTKENIKWSAKTKIEKGIKMTYNLF